MGKDNKRKRDVSAEDDAEQPSSKTRLVEDGVRNDSEQQTGSSSGAHRQMKSERRKKSAKQSKQNASKSKDKKPTTNAPSHTTIAQDDLSTGQDFVPLTDKITAEKKEKRRSPRAIRKERRQHKTEEAAAAEADSSAKVPTNGQGSRFICFVGNLPYTVTTEQIAAHFSKLQPKSIRLSTDKQTGKCKGFAFLEFENYDKMKTCLKLYHHSTFDPDHGKQDNNGSSEAHGNAKSKARKINVELTAGGGGGKSTGRRDKIKAKNQKLDEERARDWEKKKQEEQESSRGRRSMPGSGANAEQTNNESRGDIHPSRLNRVMG